MTEQWIESLPARNVAMIHAFSPMLNRALLVGATLAIVVAILMTPFVADGLPSPFQPIVTAAVGALVGTIAAFLSFPARLRRTFEAYSWLGRTEMDRFAERTGGPVPVKPDDIERWLATTPSSPATRLARGEVLAFVGRYDEAKAEIQASRGRLTRGGDGARIAAPVHRLARGRDGRSRGADRRGGQCPGGLDRPGDGGRHDRVGRVETRIRRSRSAVVRPARVRAGRHSGARRRSSWRATRG